MKNQAISFEDEDECCKYCGWRCEYIESHIIHSRGDCEYINIKYIISYDEDGELVWELRSKKCN